MYVIEDGTCAVQIETETDGGKGGGEKATTVVAKLQAGQHFGEVALVKNE
eukprot:SAG22_NODE_2486_length_2522_cov_4.407346_2_plen_50_part_00